ncbi:MAG: hypothetical protein QNJ60_05605 [Xenococcaceae cyanobacterium MO_188.B19]|nr:hypothetical protein [Xenococcaceae cyanobacterium MO_188.B19]
MSQTNHFSDSDNDALSSMINNKKQIFEIIDSIVSLESCLHYQFIPLALKDKVLTLGMINPEDKNGYNFIYPIVTSLNYSLAILPVNDKIHQSILAAYLKKDLINESHRDYKQDDSRQDFKQTVIDFQPDLVEGTPPQNDGACFDFVNNPSSPSPVEPETHVAPLNLHDRATLIVDSVEDAIASSSPEIFSSEPQITSFNALEPNASQHNKSQSHHNLLEVKAQHINDSIEALSSLAPQELWQELLARIVGGGIGRLYLERHLNHGRIICSKDGVLQSSLDRVELAVFNQIIQEIKVVGKQPPTPIEKTKKVAIEKFYDGERILIRIEFFLNQYGEEITVQILRDKALKFYEQRKVKKTMEQALFLSQKLEKTLKKMVFCRGSGELTQLSSLKSVLQKIQKQIELLENKTKKPLE